MELLYNISTIIYARNELKNVVPKTKHHYHNIIVMM